MIINGKYQISKKHNGTILTNVFSTRGKMESINSSSDLYTVTKNYLRILYKRNLDTEKKNAWITEYLTGVGYTLDEIENKFLLNTNNTTNVVTNGENGEEDNNLEARLAVAEKLINFFSEFQFTPSARFINTLAWVKEPKKYVYNYFRLHDNPNTLEVSDKIKSCEFDEIIHDLRECGEPSKHINTRIQIWEGVPGSGKTTAARELAQNTVVCRTDMSPSDLMEEFDFESGKATFKKAALWRAIESGDTILLDEINLLPDEAIKFLQGLTDEKEDFDYKGHHVVIHPNFNIIGTMNLNVNGMTFPLTEALIDRCSDVKEFNINKNFLAMALA